MRKDKDLSDVDRRISPPDDGGPAFPIPPQPNGDHDWNRAGGASLRDYFAAQALVGMRAHPANERPVDVAKWAFEVADAMLAERKK